jgi:hypothetical protein
MLRRHLISGIFTYPRPISPELTLNRLEALWGADAAEFKPSRWLKGDPCAGQALGPYANLSVSCLRFNLRPLRSEKIGLYGWPTCLPRMALCVSKKLQYVLLF